MSTSTSVDQPAADTPYAFDNSRPQASSQLGYLAEMLDPVTRYWLSDIHLGDAKCLEVGAGAGTIAVWLTELVGPNGHVTATDINPAHIPTNHPRLTVVRHDLQTEPLPQGRYDLIHERLVTQHLPAREHIVYRFAEALAPGGALVMEGWRDTIAPQVLSAPSMRARELYERYWHTLYTDILIPHGIAPDWVVATPDLMERAGLVVESVVSCAQSWRGGTAGTLLAASNIAHKRDEFQAAGWSGEDIAGLQDAMDDSRMLIMEKPFYTTVGRRPQ
jgi:SAM-dependent methyltransferase